VIGERFSVDWGYQDGLPHLRLKLCKDGAVPAINSMRGSARLTMESFGSGLPGDKTPSAPCAIVEHNEEDGSLVIALPEVMRLPYLAPKR